MCLIAFSIPSHFLPCHMWKTPSAGPLVLAVSVKKKVPGIPVQPKGLGSDMYVSATSKAPFEASFRDSMSSL